MKMRKRLIASLMAATMAAGMAAPVYAESAGSEQEPVTLKFYCYVNEQPDQQAVFDELNKYFQEKYNTTVDFQYILGSYEDKMSVVINSGEEFDACFTSAEINQFRQNVTKGAFADISGMLDDFPALRDVVSQERWDAVTVDGGIYGVPNNSMAAAVTNCLWLLDEHMEAYGLTEEDAKSWTTLIDAVDYVKFVKEEFGATLGGHVDRTIAQNLGYVAMKDTWAGAVIKRGDPEYKVVNLFETEEFKKLCEDMAEMYAMGLTDGQTGIDADYRFSERSAGRTSLAIGGTWQPGNEVEEELRYGVDLALIPWSGAGTDPLITGAAFCGTNWGVSATSKYPERVLQILELFQTDPYVIDLICYGIEGVHYNRVGDDGLIEPITDAGYVNGTTWTLVNLSLATPYATQGADVWEQRMALEESAERYLVNFMLDDSNIQSEISNVTSATKEYISIITGEKPVEETLNALLEKMELAGIDTIIAEAQAQVDAFVGK